MFTPFIRTPLLLAIQFIPLAQSHTSRMLQFDICNTVFVELKKLVIFGVGLIGGSIALALKKHHQALHITGIGRGGESLQQALDLGVIDKAEIDPAKALVDADTVIIATPVAQAAGIFQAIAPHLHANTIITDVGSTKSDVINQASAYLGDRISQFVPGHPIAGAEKSGVAAANAGLFSGKNVVLTPTKDTQKVAVEKIEQMWQYAHARVSLMTAAEHDTIFAAVSHLPHLLAFALVEEIASRSNADQLFDFAASGFRDFTRIAGSSPEMWRDICLSNRDALLSELSAYQNKLTTLTSLLQDKDAEGLQALFSRASSARNHWSNQQKEKSFIMEKLLLKPASKACGQLKLPGSKSISNRMLLLAALAEGTTEIRDLLISDDVERMLDALKTLGVNLLQTAAHDWRITGTGGDFPTKQAEIFLGNAGTAFRPLTAALAITGGNYTLSGVPRMHERPIGDLVSALQQAGAAIEYLQNPGFPH